MVGYSFLYDFFIRNPMPVYPDAIHSFCRAKAWKISPNWRRVFPNRSFRRRLGTNTTWYLRLTGQYWDA
jgi:hypothetical protein